LWLRLYASVLLALSVALAGGGSLLVSLGGSPYYLLAGLAVGGSAVLLWRARIAGGLLYALMLLATLPWSVWEAGLNGWALMPRLIAPAVLGLPLMLPAFRRRLATSSLIVTRLARPGSIALAGLGFLALSGAALLSRPDDSPDPMFQAGRIASATARPAASPGAGEEQVDWLHYGNDPGGTRYSRLAQITPANVSDLEVAWTYHVGETSGLQVTPIKVGDTVYLCNSYNDVIALDAETGKERWRWSARIDRRTVPYAVCRGVAHYRVPGANGACAERILTNTTDARLVALDARTGLPCAGFGAKGQVSLLTGLTDKPGFYAVTSAPTIAGGKVVLGGWITDGQRWGAPAGVVRAFDAVTGELSWAFDAGRTDRQTLPAGEKYTHSTPNAWAPYSSDEALGLVYIPTGSPSVDYFGGLRRPFDHAFANSVVALELATGKVRWSFRTSHNDLWDYDVASQPTLADFRVGTALRKAVIVPTKRGEIFVLDRETGQPIRKIEERAVPQAGAVSEERLSPTQPFSVAMPSFRGPDLSERTMWGLTPLDQLWCRIRFRQARYEGTATPPGLTPNIAYPGYNGGIDWGGVSVDRERQIIFVNSNRFANYDRLIPRAKYDSARMKRGGHLEPGAAPQDGAPYAADIQIFWSPLRIPCNQPPYGKIAAVDLPTGKLLWQRTFGNGRESGPLGIPSKLPLEIGTPNNGGSVATRSGLLFIAATVDSEFRAFDSATGRILWRSRLPAGGQATPMTYLSPASGRQFVVIAAGGHPAMRSVPGDAIVAYALPRNKTMRFVEGLPRRAGGL
jgi:quinoprotein glucose dehydrogenase